MSGKKKGGTDKLKDSPAISKEDKGPYDSQGNLREGWVLDRAGKPCWAPLWNKQDAEALQYSVDDTQQRIGELELELEASKQLITEQFFQALAPGELVECTGICDKIGIYSAPTIVSGGFSECFEVFPGLSPGETMLYLGWADPPGEEIKLRSNRGTEKVCMLTGPKWLIGDRVYIASVPIGLLNPYEIEVEDEFAQKIGIDFKVLDG